MTCASRRMNDATTLRGYPATHHHLDLAQVAAKGAYAMTSRFDREKLVDKAEIGCLWAGATQAESREQAREVVSYVLANVEVCQAYFHTTDLTELVDKAARYGWGQA